MARPEDVEAAAELVVRLKRLNGEFDPMFKVRDDFQQTARKYLQEAIVSQSNVVLVADMQGKIVALVKADLRDRKFYEPKTEGAIIEFYLLPEYRRQKLGETLLRHTVDKLKEKGAKIVTAEFPSQNMIAASFYEKKRFRRLVCVYAAEPSETS